MSLKTRSNNYHINLDVPSGESETSNNTQTTKYIIENNKDLQSKLNDMKEELNELQKQNDDLETDNERMEKGKTYMRGLIVNYSEAIKLYNEAFENVKKDSKEIKKHYLTNMFNIFSFLLISFSLSFAIDNWYSVLTHLILNVGFAYFSYNEYRNSKALFNYTKAKKNITEVNKIISAQDVLTDHLDNI